MIAKIEPGWSALAVLVMLGSVISARVAWQASPSLPTCAAFWMGVATLVVTSRLWILAPGFSCNALATMSNGGHMPVFFDEPIGGIWIAGSEQTALPWLCDRFWTFSVGDGLIVGGFLVVGALAASRAARPS